ncbi:hypothetical protein IBTHAUMO2_450014 [Nitrosopumilaceae archaeon]|nr:hypothetical protein IBTHAUMO2_450014 [Nitrosopumilaceae archaeon]
MDPHDHKVAAQREPKMSAARALRGMGVSIRRILKISDNKPWHYGPRARHFRADSGAQYMNMGLWRMSAC